MKSAERGGYAVGAFNVYNLEGVQAVVAAAEELQSPAILQACSLKNKTFHSWLSYEHILHDFINYFCSLLSYPCSNL